MKVSISNVKIVTLVFLLLGLVVLLDLSSVESHGSGSHKCNHGHDHGHDHHAHKETKLPEEEDMKLYGFGFHDHHDVHDDDDDDHKDQHFGILQLTGPGVWMHAMGCSFLVSLASLICLIILPVVFVQGKPSKAVVDSLALFGAGAMLGDAFLHQLPHAFGGGHSHDHQEEHNHDHGSSHSHSHSHSHAHSLSDLSVGMSVLAGIVIFLLVEKVVRYVEDNSGGSNAWSHGHHHHHHHNKSKKLKEDDENGTREDEKPALENIDEVELLDEEPSDSSNKNLSNIRKRHTANSDNKEDKQDAVDANESSSGNAKSSKEDEHAQPQSLVFGYLNLFSDGVHNFTDGMALGSAFLVHGSVGGWSRTLFLLAHEIPQEVGDFGILVRSGFSVSKALFFNFLSALVALAGTALALLWGRDPGQSSLIEGFTAGGFIYIAVAGVLAEMNSNSKTTVKSVAAQLTSLILGMSVALCISLVE